MTIFEIIGVTVAFATASFFNSISGFGFALVAMPFLTLVVGPKIAVIFITVISLILRLLLMYKTRHDFGFEVLLPALVGVIAGSLPGSYLLKISDNANLKIFLGLVLFVAVLVMKREASLPIKNMRLGRLVAGALCGFFSACTSIGGPPLALWFVNEKMDKVQMRGNLTWIFAFSTCMTLIASYYTGVLNLFESWELVLYGLPGTALGFYFGNKFFDRVNQYTFKKVVIGVIIFGAVSSLVGGILEKF